MPCENLYYQSPSVREVRDFKYFSHKDFCDDLSQIPWETIITINDPNACWCDYYLKSIFIYKILNNLAAPNLNNMFLKIRNCPIPYNLRNTNTDLVLPKPKTEFKKRDYSYTGALE